MIVSEYGSAYYGEVCIGAYKVMRENRNEIEHLYKRASVYLHRCMLCGKRYAMLVVVYVR
jgi:hypothetical protein